MNSVMRQQEIEYQATRLNLSAFAMAVSRSRNTSMRGAERPPARPHGSLRRKYRTPSEGRWSGALGDVAWVTASDEEKCMVVSTGLAYRFFQGVNPRGRAYKPGHRRNKGQAPVPGTATKACRCSCRRRIDYDRFREYRTGVRPEISGHRPKKPAAGTSTSPLAPRRPLCLPEGFPVLRPNTSRSAMSTLTRPRRAV